MNKKCAHKNVKHVGHNRKDGRGIFGAHWECTRKGCEFNNDAWLYDSIKGECYLYCSDCRTSKFMKGNYEGVNLRDWFACGPKGATLRDLVKVFNKLKKEDDLDDD
jgi:hypothetical protein